MYDNDEFEKLVISGIDALPEKVLKLMENVAVVIDDESLAGDMFGLYEGVPLTERGESYSGFLPDKITIFKSTILAAYEDSDDIKACVANTVWHEVAHHFGYDEEWIEVEEIKRGKTL